jgi:hypothetical protein
MQFGQLNNIVVGSLLIIQNVWSQLWTLLILEEQNTTFIRCGAPTQRHSIARAVPHSTHTRTVHDDSFWILDPTEIVQVGRLRPDLEFPQHFVMQRWIRPHSNAHCPQCGEGWWLKNVIAETCNAAYHACVMLLNYHACVMLLCLCSAVRFLSKLVVRFVLCCCACVVRFVVLVNNIVMLIVFM